MTPVLRINPVQLAVPVTTGTVTQNLGNLNAAPGGQIELSFQPTKRTLEIKSVNVAFPAADNPCDLGASQLNQSPAICIIRGDATPGTYSVQCVIVSSCTGCEAIGHLTASGTITVVAAA